MKMDNSILYGKLRAARSAFEREPKVYGNGLGIRMHKETR